MVGMFTVLIRITERNPVMYNTALIGTHPHVGR